MQHKLFLLLMFLTVVALTTVIGLAADMAIQAEPASTPDNAESAQPADSSSSGDVNCNTIPYEVADAVMLARYFQVGLIAFEDHIECSIVQSDINNDGIVLTIADLVFLLRIMVGDTLDLPAPAPPGRQADR